MKLLEEKIRKEGQILSGNILKVSSFLNHQIDVLFLDKLAQEFVRRFEGEKITKVLTIEASGIGIGSCVARAFKCPLVFAKKNSPSLAPAVANGASGLLDISSKRELSIDTIMLLA